MDLQGILDHLTDADCRHGDGALLGACQSFADLARQRADGTTPSLAELLDLVRLTVLLLKRRFESLDPKADDDLDRECRELFMTRHRSGRQSGLSTQAGAEAGKGPRFRWRWLACESLFRFQVTDAGHQHRCR
jgi:hypothetical protein